MLTSSLPARPFGRRTGARAIFPSFPRPGWRTAGVVALLCSGVAWAALPHATPVRVDDHGQWQSLAIAPLSSGGATGMRMAATEAAEPVEFVAHRAVPIRPVTAVAAPSPAVLSTAPLRIRGRVGDGLYWSLRAAGASPQVAAQYLAALATEIDVGDVEQNATFDLVLGAGSDLLYAGLNRAGERELQLVRWNENGRGQWVDAANADRPEPVQTGMMMPANGPITSYFGNRYHPILHFTRFHAGVDIGAGWGSPIVAAADGQVAAAGWAGGYGREVQIAHGGGLVSLYGHMSEIVAQPGSFVRRGQLIGYVGSSGLSTGPHLHFEVRMGGTPVNPLGVRFTSASVIDTHLADAVKARLKVLLGVGPKQS